MCIRAESRGHDHWLSEDSNDREAAAFAAGVLRNAVVQLTTEAFLPRIDVNLLSHATRYVRELGRKVVTIARERPVAIFTVLACRFPGFCFLDIRS